MARCRRAIGTLHRCLPTSQPLTLTCRLTCKGFVRPASEAARGLKLRRLGGTQPRLAELPRLREVDVAEVPACDWSEGFLLQLAEQVREGVGLGSTLST